VFDIYLRRSQKLEITLLEEHMLRARPIWIETRVPARLNCPHCKAKERALLDPNSVENSYEYACEVCGRRTTFTLAELNDPAMVAAPVLLKRITA